MMVGSVGCIDSEASGQEENVIRNAPDNSAYERQEQVNIRLVDDQRTTRTRTAWRAVCQL